MEQNIDFLFKQHKAPSESNAGIVPSHEKDNQNTCNNINSHNSSTFGTKEYLSFSSTDFLLNSQGNQLDNQEMSLCSMKGRGHKFSPKLKIKVENGFSLRLEEKVSSNSTSASTPLEYIRTNSSNSYHSNDEREAQNLIHKESNIERGRIEANNIEPENMINIQSSPVNNSSNSSQNLPTRPEQNENQTQENQNQGNVAQNTTETLSDSLDFVLTKTPVLSIFMTLIFLALGSGIMLSFLEEKYSHHYLFIILNVFLLYLLIERVFRLMKDIPSNNRTFSNIIQRKSFYNVLDISTYFFLSLVANLRLSQTIETLSSGLYFLIGTFVLYCICSKASLKEKVLGISKRLFFIVQFWVIMLKVNNELHFSWKLILCAAWIILGGYWIRVWECISKILTAFSGQNIFSFLSRQAKIIGIFALFMILADIVILMMVLVGACKVLDEEAQGIQYFKTWLTVSQYLNAVMLFYGTITGVDLIEFILSANEFFNGNSHQNVNCPRAKKLVFVQKEVKVVKISPTYYKVLEDSLLEDGKHENKAKSLDKLEFEEKKKEGTNKESLKTNEIERKSSIESQKSGSEDNICYICCGKDANGIVLTCGHGGICYDCLIDYINKKDECMECRRRVESVLKIEEEIKCGKVFRGNKVCQVIRA